MLLSLLCKLGDAEVDRLKYWSSMEYIIARDLQFSYNVQEGTLALVSCLLLRFPAQIKFVAKQMEHIEQVWVWKTG